ncbi:hypothetical protein EDC02_5497 [Micromonospora sp. Llam0]|nr:hypothetical protein EDC02_5497 [Micromonospora sp. Llam0]
MWTVVVTRARRPDPAGGIHFSPRSAWPRHVDQLLGQLRQLCLLQPERVRLQPDHPVERRREHEHWPTRAGDQARPLAVSDDRHPRFTAVRAHQLPGRGRAGQVPRLGHDVGQGGVLVHVRHPGLRRLGRMLQPPLPRMTRQPQRQRPSPAPPQRYTIRRSRRATKPGLPVSAEPVTQPTSLPPSVMIRDLPLSPSWQRERTHQFARRKQDRTRGGKPPPTLQKHNTGALSGYAGGLLWTLGAGASMTGGSGGVRVQQLRTPGTGGADPIPAAATRQHPHRHLIRRHHYSLGHDRQAHQHQPRRSRRHAERSTNVQLNTDKRHWLSDGAHPPARSRPRVAPDRGRQGGRPGRQLAVLATPSTALGLLSTHGRQLWLPRRLQQGWCQ